MSYFWPIFADDAIVKRSLSRGIIYANVFVVTHDDGTKTYWPFSSRTASVSLNNAEKFARHAYRLVIKAKEAACHD